MLVANFHSFCVWPSPTNPWKHGYAHMVFHSQQGNTPLFRKKLYIELCANPRQHQQRRPWKHFHGSRTWLAVSSPATKEAMSLKLLRQARVESGVSTGHHPQGYTSVSPLAFPQQEAPTVNTISQASLGLTVKTGFRKMKHF